MDKLKNLVDRITALEMEKRDVGNDIKDVYTEAKSQGFDVKALRRVVRDNLRPITELRSEEHAVSEYRAKLGIEV
jgi:uncharacterized protein (UPF0335 family)